MTKRDPLQKYQRPNNRHGIKAEKRTASRLGGKLTPASGSKSHSKGDFSLGNFLVENKSTTNRSLSLKREWLDKIEQEAAETGKTPAVTVQFVNRHGNPESAWVLIPEELFKELL